MNFTDRNDFIKRGDFYRFNTESGPSIVFMPSPGSATVAVYVFVKGGIRDEIQEANGLSHLCEHMVFNGTSRMDQRELFHRITETGAYFNAFTRRDYTLYYAVFPVEFTLDSLDLLSSMLFQSRMDRESFEKEKFIISQEIRESSLRDDYHPEKLFLKEMFKGSPYSLPVLGTEETLQNITPEQLTGYYREKYVPSNLRILVMGDLPEYKARRYCRYFFYEKHINAGGTTAVPGEENLSCNIGLCADEIPAPAFNFAEKVALIKKQLNTQKNYVYLAIEAPGTESPDFLPFNLFSELIYTGGSLSLENRMRNQLKENFRELYITYLFWKDRGLLVFRILTGKGFSPEKTLNILTEQLVEIPDSPIPQKDLNEFLITEEANRCYGKEKIDLYGLLEAQSFINMDFEMFANFIDDIKTVTPDKIRKTAKEILSSGRYLAFAAGDFGDNEIKEKPGLLLSIPKTKSTGKETEFHLDQKPGKILALENSGFSLQPENRINKHDDSNPKAAKVFKLNSGINLILECHPGSKVFALCLCSPDRRLYETPGKKGIGELTASLMPDGCSGLSRGEFISRLNGMGAILKTSMRKSGNEDNYNINEQSVIRFETLNRFAEDGIKLVADIVMNPNFHEEDIAVRKGQLMTLINENGKKSITYARQLFYEKITGCHPYSTSPLGEIEDIKSITRKDLLDFRNKIFNPANITIAIETSLPEEQVINQMEEAFSVMQHSDINKNDSTFVSIPQFNPPVYGKFQHLSGSEISAIVMGFPLNVPPEDEAAFNIAFSLLSSSISYQLREKQGFVYSVRTTYEKTRYGNFIISSLETSRENCEMAANSLREIITTFYREFVTADDVKRITGNFRGRIRMARLSSVNRAFYLTQNRILNEPLNYPEILLKQMEKLTPYQVGDVLKSYLNNEEIVEVIVF